MTQVREFTLPDVGEGLTEAEILAWHVAVGDHVSVNQVLVEIETAKAAVELPSPFAGVVTALLVEPGVVVPVGTPIIAIAVAVGDPASEIEPGSTPGEPVPQLSAPEQWAAAAAPAAPESKREAVLVGYGVAPSSATRRPRRSSRPDEPRRSSEPSQPTELEPELNRDFESHASSGLEAAVGADSSIALRRGGFEVASAAQARFVGGASPSASPVRAKPPVRKRAKELGVDLAAVTATGPHGDVTRADVEGASALAAGALGTRTGHPGHPGQPSHVLEPGGTTEDRTDREERIPVRGVLRAMAEAMVLSASTAPHVTEWVAVDVSETVRLGARLRTLPEFDGASVGPTLVAAWALCRALARHPRVNASWDESGGEVVVKHYVNLGVAAATPRGLVVPVVKDADTLDLAGLAHALTALTAAARAGTTAPGDLREGTISLTNVGVFGVDGGTPILVPGQGAILCLGQVAERPWVVDGVVVPRSVCQLTLSFDHRFIDGELASGLLADVAATMSDPIGELVRASLGDPVPPRAKVRG